VSIAFVYTLFRTSQYFLNRQEQQALQAIEQVAHQRELISEMERLVAFAQNRTAPQYPVTVRLLVDTYRGLIGQHALVMPKLHYLGRRCQYRPCEALLDKNYFNIDADRLERDLLSNKLPLRKQNALLQRLFELSVRYHLALKDTMSLSFNVIQSKNKTNTSFDLIAYFSLIALLLVQAVYVFRPAIRRLNASMSTRSDFMSRISHEIRNPMNSIIGMADILKSTKLNSEQQHYVDNLLRSGHALLDLLNNLIDSSAIERGKLSLKPQPFDLLRSLDRSLNLVAIQAHHKNLNLYLHANPGLPSNLIGDSVRLEQVLVNLLSNAVKFTEQGHVSLDVDVASEDAESVELAFAVSDSGIGIKNEILGQIFDSFVQADSGIQRKYGGSGLGLSIASELIRMMGGELKVESEYGQGSRFYFTISLPRQRQRVLDGHPPAPNELASREFIFLVSYAESSAYKKFFERVGAPAALLHSSQDLRAYLNGGGHQKTAEVLIDDSIGIISMITCRNLAEEHGLGEKAVALTRSGFTKENMDLLKRNGFKRFRIKPLRPWDLSELPPPINEELAQQTFTQNLEVVNKLKEKNLRILLVDDSNDNLFLLKEVVNPLASSVHFAENGLEALEKFGRNVYDVVFMDIQMPVMDGYTAIRKIREMEAKTGRSVPIFAVTAHAGLVDAQKCREAGFTDRIVKPVVRRDIYVSLSKAFSLDLGDMAAEETQALPAKYMEKLLPGFLMTRAEDMAKLQAALDNADFNTVSQLGHKMKGSSASYGFKDAAEFSKQLEDAAKNKDLDLCRGLARRLEESFAKLGQPRGQSPQPDLL
jgi:signal transduction histidine kinase/CheY-like chemotaxis protein